MKPQEVTVTRPLEEHPAHAIASEKLVHFSDEHRQAMAERMAKLIDLDDTSISTETGDALPETNSHEKTPSYSPRVYTLLHRMSQELERNRSGQDDEDVVWTRSITSLIDRANQGVIHPHVAYETALVMARLSGHEKDYMDSAAVDKAFITEDNTRGLVVTTEDGYIPVQVGEAKLVNAFIDRDPDYGASDIGVYQSLIKTMTSAEIVDIFLEKNKIQEVANYLYTFRDLSQTTAMSLVEEGYAGHVLLYHESFKDLDDRTLAYKILEAKESSGTTVLKDYVYKLKGLDNGIAHKFLDEGMLEYVAGSLHSYDNLSPDIARHIMDATYLSEVARNIKHFEVLDSGSYLSLIHNGYADDLIKDVERIKVHPDVLKELKEAVISDAHIVFPIIENLDVFGFKEEEIASILWQAVASDDYDIAQKLLSFSLVDKFGLDPESAQSIDTALAEVRKPIDGVEPNNPYKDTMGSHEYVTITIPGTELHKTAVEIQRLIRTSEKDKSPWEQVSAQINLEYKQLVSQLTKAVDEQTAQSVLGDGKGTNSLLPVYRRLVSDYIALELSEKGKSVEGMHSADISVMQDKVSRALGEANQKFLEIFSRDVSYYDKLFTEWDIKQIGQKDFQEVFLGRDGIYAYVGRRAQMQARQRALGLDDASLAPAPTYLVYPRQFMNFTTDVKRQYLDQYITNPKAAHYYDTGFTGTIPQDIMEVFGMEAEEWDQRIRLLSAGSRDRTVLGLGGTEDTDRRRRSEVTEIEDNVKDEQSAAGLFYDEDSKDLKHYAQPAKPDDRLSFALIQQALHRHYYTKELQVLGSQQKQVEMKRHVVEGVELRLRSQLSPEQTTELVSLFDSGSIGQKLLATATDVQLSDPNNAYPDEAVFELPLTGTTTGMMIKSVVRTKQQGPLDEFEALLLLEKLGVDAPKPLARIFTTEQQGFIAIEKLPGVSGRTFAQQPEIQKLPLRDKQKIFGQALEQMKEITEKIRRDTGLDKTWTIDDFMVVTGKDRLRRTVIERMLPINFERARIFDTNSPEITYLGQGLDELLVAPPPVPKKQRRETPSNVTKTVTDFGANYSYYGGEEEGEEEEMEEQEE